MPLILTHSKKFRRFLSNSPRKCKCTFEMWGSVISMSHEALILSGAVYSSFIGMFFQQKLLLSVKKFIIIRKVMAKLFSECFVLGSGFGLTELSYPSSCILCPSLILSQTKNSSITYSIISYTTRGLEREKESLLVVQKT